MHVTSPTYEELQAENDELREYADSDAKLIADLRKESGHRLALLQLIDGGVERKRRAEKNLEDATDRIEFLEAQLAAAREENESWGAQYDQQVAACKVHCEAASERENIAREETQELRDSLRALRESPPVVWKEDLAAAGSPFRKQLDQVDALLFAAPNGESALKRAAKLEALLIQIQTWDHMQTAADGPFWLREIAAALAETAPEEGA